eukprot:TRINITY_DN3912_c0_g1_i3.p3 TRINITY_DN3912_c0_g1~~TRINITY_DN3912_c0_g1_i3.p3  ORF type:complete len:190 (+),score=43.47 TRINITY_DN3912_c0_g1_i3:141-710(+)
MCIRDRLYILLYQLLQPQLSPSIPLLLSLFFYFFVSPNLLFPLCSFLAIDRIAEIHARIPNTHLVMHGSSSVPQELLAEIREFGGDMKETYGVPVEEIVKGIKHGVRKVNIDTDIRLAMTGAIRRYLAEHPDKFDPRDYLKPAREAAKKICLARFEAFGTAGNASKIKAIGLDKMAERYAKGELNQIVR